MVGMGGMDVGVTVSASVSGVDVRLWAAGREEGTAKMSNTRVRLMKINRTGDMCKFLLCGFMVGLFYIRFQMARMDFP